MDIPNMTLLAWLVVGAIAGFLASEIMGTREGLVMMVVLGIVGGRLYHVVSDPELYFESGRDPLNALKIWDGGLGIWATLIFEVLPAPSSSSKRVCSRLVEKWRYLVSSRSLFLCSSVIAGSSSLTTLASLVNLSICELRTFNFASSAMI